MLIWNKLIVLALHIFNITSLANQLLFSTTLHK